MNETEKERLRLFVLGELKEDADLFDFEAEIDSTLCYSENKTILTEKMALFKQNESLDIDTIKRGHLIKAKISQSKACSPKWLSIPIIKTKDCLLAQAFANKRVIAMAGERNSGKTNNLVRMLQQFREMNTKTPILTYGLPWAVQKYLNSYGCKEISSLSQLIKKKDCIIILDEFQRLKLNDRRYKDALDEFMDYVYHNNVYSLLSSPNIREFNSIIGGVIERWLLKDVKLSSCVNGSQLKKAIDSYKGRYKELGSISIPKNEILVVNDDRELVLHCEYVPEADTKSSNKSPFETR